MRRPWGVLFVVGFIIGVQGIAALNLAGADGVQVSDGVPLDAPDGPTVVLYGNTNASLENATSTHTVNITSEAGNLTLYSNGSTSANVHASNLSGTWTNITDITANRNLSIQPGDKNMVNVSGGVDDISIQNMSVDDGQPDFWINGSGQANLTIHNLPANQEIQAVNESGMVMDTANTTAGGVGYFELNLSSHTILLQTNTSSNATDNPGMPQPVWLFIGVIALGTTGVAASTKTPLVRTYDNANDTAILSGVLGFISWGIWSYGALAVAVVMDGNTIIVLSMPALTYFGVMMALIPGYIALTGPVNIVRRAREPDAQDL